MQQVLSGKMSYSSFFVHQGFDSQQQLLHQYKNSRKREIVIKTNSNLSNSSNLKSNWQPNKQLLRGVSSRSFLWLISFQRYQAFVIFNLVFITVIAICSQAHEMQSFYCAGQPSTSSSGTARNRVSVLTKQSQDSSQQLSARMQDLLTRQDLIEFSMLLNNATTVSSVLAFNFTLN